MVNLSDKTIETIEKYCGENSGELIKSRIASLDKPLTIANTGVVNSGKSSLFNALIESTDERFKVGAARTTASRDVESLTDDIFLVDTPGIDIKDEDDVIAREAVLGSSVIVMVHNIKTGMLQRSEVEWLKSLAQSFPSADAIKDRVVLVCSWKDAREREEDYQRTLDETHRMANEALGCEIDMYAVSAERYMKGVRENKPRLCELSGVTELKAALIEKTHSYAQKYGTDAIMDEIAVLCRKYISVLKDEKAKTKREIDDITSSVSARFDAEKKEWSTKFGTFRRMHREYIRIRNEIKDIRGELL